MPFKYAGIMHIADTSIKNPSKDKIAWAAGLYEGEGTFFWIRFYYIHGEKRERKTAQPHLRICMTDLPPLLKWQKIFGGRINGPYPSTWRGSKKGKKKWLLSLDCKAHAERAIKLMWPHLSQRRKAQCLLNQKRSVNY